MSEQRAHELAVHRSGARRRRPATRGSRRPDRPRLRRYWAAWPTGLIVRSSDIRRERRAPKGNALEREVAARLRAVDGADHRLAALETSGGRLGPAYTLQIDVATRHLAVECKSREDHPPAYGSGSGS
jgi:hypothetical protein